MYIYVFIYVHVHVYIIIRIYLFILFKSGAVLQTAIATLPTAPQSALVSTAYDEPKVELPFETATVKEQQQLNYVEGQLMPVRTRFDRQNPS